MELDLELADGEGGEGFEDGGQGVEFPAFEVDFEDVDVGMTWVGEKKGR